VFPLNQKISITKLLVIAILSLGVVLGGLVSSPAFALQNVTPWSTERSLQNLVYGSSSFNDVTSAVGRQPDDIVRSQSMYPVITNFYYYDENKSGAATVFVFENGLLVGLQYKSPDNQFVDFTYCLQNNGDRRLNNPYLAGYQGYYPYFPLYAPQW
jgi:hypothetical protein